MPTRREALEQTKNAGVALPSPAQAPQNTNAGVSIKSVMRREETVMRYPVQGDNWHMSWAADDRQYAGLCDGGGLWDPPRTFYNSRMLTIEGGPTEARFHDLPGYPVLGAPTQGPLDVRYYNYGTLALDDVRYQFLATWNLPKAPSEFGNLKPNELRCVGAKLIYSPDRGRTWHNQNGSTPVLWETWSERSLDTQIFFGEDQEAFSLLSILQMGKNYEHNRDGFIYVYAPNGNTDGTMNELVMFRVPKTQLLRRAAYEYFAGFQTSGQAKWSREILERKPVHIFPRGWVNTLVHPYAWHPCVVYNAPLGLYMMVNYGLGVAPDGLWFGKPSYLGLWIAPHPWGPWTQIHEETAWTPAGERSARAYQPQIAPKWIAPDGRSFWLVWSDYQVSDRNGIEKERVKFNKLIDTHQYLDAEMIRVASIRKFMPHYAFNVQRVDLDVK